MENMSLSPLTVAAQGTESRGDQLANFLASEAGDAVASLGEDYVQPQLSDPKAGLERCRHLLAVAPELLDGTCHEALRLRFEAMESAYNSLLASLHVEIQTAYGQPALSRLYNQLERMATEAIANWHNRQRERAISALRSALRGVEQAYRPLQTKPFQGTGSRSKAARKGVPNPGRKAQKTKGNKPNCKS